MKSFGQELLNDGNVVEQRRLGQTAFLRKIMPVLADHFGSGTVVLDRLLHNACFAKHGQQSSQRFRIASADSVLPAPKLQETIHHHAVQIADWNLFLLKPSAEIADYDDLSSDRVASVTLVRQTGCKRIEIFAQRSLPEPFYRS